MAEILYLRCIELLIISTPTDPPYKNMVAFQLRVGSQQFQFILQIEIKIVVIAHKLSGKEIIQSFEKLLDNLLNKIS